jgi:hypothetical protein
MTGMESGAAVANSGGLFNSVNTAGGTVSADASVARSGNYALKVNDTSAAGVTNAR